MRIDRLGVADVARLGGPRGAAASVRALVPDGASVEDVVREIVGRVREEGDAAVREYTRRFDTEGNEPKPLVVGAARAGRGDQGAATGSRRRAAGGDRERRGGGPGGRGREQDRDVAAGAERDPARGSGGDGGRIRPWGPSAVSEHCRDGRRDRPCGGRAGCRRLFSAGRRRRDRPRDPRDVSACAGWSACTGSAERRRSPHWPTARRRSAAWT